jgi:DNA end-binding protein Ku
MAPRATSSGTISFGLVSIPVKVYPATSGKGVHFNMLHARDRSRLKQQYVCSNCGEVVERSDTVRGYEYARDHYAVLSEEELKSLEQESDRSIEIEEFIPIEKVDPVYFEKSQILGPDKGGQKAYRLLWRAMRDAGRVALGRFSTRGRQQLVLLRPTEDGLLMHGLYYADEVRDAGEIEMGEEVEFKKGELALASQLIDQLTNEDFEPEKYEDRYRQAVLELVDRKVAGEEVVAAPREEPREQIIDLVAALKRSLSEKREGGPVAEERKRARKPAVAKGARSSARRKSGSS